MIAPALSRFRFDWLLIDLLWLQAPRRAQARHRPSGLSLLDTKDLGLDFRREFIKRGHIIMSAITNDDHCTITNTTKSILISLTYIFSSTAPQIRMESKHNFSRDVGNELIIYMVPQFVESRFVINFVRP